MISRSLGIHSGTFHADEVAATALLIIFGLIDRENIVRTRDEKMLQNLEYVCDVGGVYDPYLKRFDHHQKEYEGKLSSAGMVLLYLRDQNKISQDIYHLLDSKIIHGIDEIDNGFVEPLEGHASFSSIIANYIPISYEASKEEMDHAFIEAVNFTIWHLKQIIDRYEYAESAKGFVQREMEKNEKVLIFESSMPWMEAFFEMGGEMHPAQFVIMPTGHHWKLRGIPPSYANRMKVRKPLPENWAGLLNEDLKKESQIEGAIFCHKGRFISIWESREDALKALNKVLD